MHAMTDDRVYYSKPLKGEWCNYGWIVRCDVSDGCLGINQTKEGAETDRVLLSPKQVAEIVMFYNAHKPRRKAVSR
jgi:hypothetical protein